MSRRVVCANCGGRGHVFKQCPRPTISCGVICRDRVGRLLMVQRKDSYAFVEFVRGKYSVDDREYLLELFEGMTGAERWAVGTSAFPELWRMLWNGFARSRGRPEYEDARRKFALLRGGARADLAWLLRATRGAEAPEWGFPKGRRAASGESDLDCAFREMREETGVGREQVRLVGGDARFEETFRGSNGVDYKHVYFLADLVADGEPSLATCDREVRAAEWTPADEVCRRVASTPTRLQVVRDALARWARRSAEGASAPLPAAG